MFIGIIGATGNIGQKVVTEALTRGHHVNAFTRDLARATTTHPNLTWTELDVFDSAAVAAQLPGLDVLISGYQPGNAARDFADTVTRSIADPGTHVAVARSLLNALATHPRTRLLVIGGAGSLEVEPGRVMADDEGLPGLLESIGLPGEYAAAARGARDGLDVLRTSNRRWTYLSPAIEVAPGERTGRYRIGTDQPVTDADGRSRISFDDIAVALLDEVEVPRFIQRRFTIGY
ncbi:NAD(P)-dependent oxidoreductase [Nocardia mexicana]|uniref:NAD(P)-binding domain-containing protein n=1 Tax=Nocardia mexicana TaxID=279262 RepID=A0A370HBT2_9NOCA|nr:NAD(P)H-binding protein [Nocardia mexicana]RDI54406.1 hypothetical protein DFR68_102531 [Nocardia mexicana]